MKNSTRRMAMVVVLGAVLASGAIPAGATSAYHMNGQGSLTLNGGGLPACMGGQGDCANVDITFSWGDLTVQGAGLLANNNIAGQYKCKSEGSVGGVPFQTRIKGNASNFQLTFNFVCELLGGVGTNFINGWFSNVTSGSSGAYRDVSAHPHPTPVASGAFAFKGYFATSNIHPYSIGNSNGEQMSCGGGFAPTSFSNLRITTAAFLGACTAAE